MSNNILKIPYKTNQSNPTIVAYKEAVEKGRKNHHIIPKGDKWVVKTMDSNETVDTFNTKGSAVNYAESIAAAGTAIFIHDASGLIRERRDY